MIQTIHIKLSVVPQREQVLGKWAAITSLPWSVFLVSIWFCLAKCPTAQAFGLPDEPGLMVSSCCDG